MFKRVILMALAVCLSWLSLAQAADFSGPVVSVLDGDTLEVLHHQHPEPIRLSGGNCPEKRVLQTK